MLIRICLLSTVSLYSTTEELRELPPKPSKARVIFVYFCHFIVIMGVGVVRVSPKLVCKTWHLYAHDVTSGLNSISFY